ncbi:MAG: MoaD family protein [Deltaproteobacteria bacterium]|nr:MoaD family protein [Deltaproteobacteria bacterium]
MKITFRTFGAFAEAIGARETAFDLPPGERIGGLLDRLCGVHPALRGDLFDAAGQIKPYLIILKNGRSVSSLQQLETVIDEGDVIAVFPPVGGG